MVLADQPPSTRNPGPSWGYAFLRRLDRISPRLLTDALMGFGSAIAVVSMPAQRRYSAEYLSLVFGRRPRWIEIWRHFNAFTHLLLTRLRIAGGANLPARLSEPDEAYMSVLRSGDPCLFGTFHFGHSDLVGFVLSEFGRRVSMIRLRVGNSSDTDLLEKNFGRLIKFIWVNEPQNVLYAIKDALQNGESVAMKCDRVEFASKTEPFHFLGRWRLFPFTIYHLAVMFDVPAVFAFAIPDWPDGTRVFGPPIFRPDPALSKADNLARARTHFQAVLNTVEKTLHEHPYLWFNFLPMNPEVDTPPAASEQQPITIPGEHTRS